MDQLKQPSLTPSLPPESFLRKSPKPENSLISLAINNLQPTQDFIDECSGDIDVLAELLKTSVRGVAEVLVGGSLKKGTTIKDNADLDVVVFLNRFTSMCNYIQSLPCVIEELQRTIRQHKPQEYAVIEGQTRSALKLKLRKKIKHDFLDIDLLPAMDNLKHDKQALYHEMSRATERDREYYSSSLAPLQIEFVRERIKDSPNMKNLIRLVKYWRKTHFPLKEGTRKKFPTSYVLELITIRCWEKAAKPVSFNLEKAFKAVMSCLADYSNIDIHWTDNYRREDFRNTAVKVPGSPYVLDPANPFNNVCRRFDSGWSDVARLARLSMEGELLRAVVTNETNWAN